MPGTDADSSEATGRGDGNVKVVPSDESAKLVRLLPRVPPPRNPAAKEARPSKKSKD